MDEFPLDGRKYSDTICLDPTVNADTIKFLSYVPRIFWPYSIIRGSDHWIFIGFKNHPSRVEIFW